jgi:hypothetical protein
LGYKTVGGMSQISPYCLSFLKHRLEMVVFTHTILGFGIDPKVARDESFPMLPATTLPYLATIFAADG